MNPQEHDAPQPIKPEELTAFVDGLLPDRDRLRVEAWLKSRPDLAAEVAGHRRIMQVWSDASVPHPSERAWQTVERNVRRALDTPFPQGSPNRIRMWSLAAAGMVAASLLAAAVVYNRDPVGESQMIFAVAAEQDVEIQSMQVSDRDSLLVGRLPMEEPMVFVSAGDVQVEELEEDTDGMRPQVLLEDNPAIPMVLVPMTPTRR